jgi:subtilisin-like proprotein convertase family protein
LTRKCTLRPPEPASGFGSRRGPETWLWVLLTGFLWILPVMSQQAPQAVFANPQTLLIPTSGVASPYPSTIGVVGVGGHVAKVTVRVAGLTHTWPQDLDVLVVGPQGQSVLLLSGAGGQQTPRSVNLTFDDDAAQPLPGDPDSAITSGSYRPTNDGGDWITLPSPAPQGSYSEALSVFKGTDPNGNWQLFVFDDMGGNRGRIDMGWSLTITLGP